MLLRFKDFLLFHCLLLCLAGLGLQSLLNAESGCQEAGMDGREVLPLQESECLLLTLTSAISRALNDNRQLLGAVETLTNAQYGVDLAKSEFNIQITPNSRAGYVGGGRAGTGWSVGGGVDISKKFATGTQLFIGPTILKTGKHYHTELQALVSQPLLRGLGSEYQLAGVWGAQFALRTAYRNLYMAQVQLIIRTIQALYEVIKAEKSLLLNQESYQRVRQFHQAAKLKEKIGLADSLDVYRAEIELRHAEDGLTGAQERLQEAEDVVRDLLALPLDRWIKVDLPLTYTPQTLSLEEAIRLALENRIEMDQAEDQRRENCRLSRLAKKNLYPELNLVLNYSNCGQDEIFTRSCTRHRESTWGIGLTTSADFDPLAERIAYEQSLLGIEAAARGIDQAKTTVTLEVKKAMRQLKRAYQRIHLQENQIKTAQGELCLAKAKFDRGMADNFHVIQAEKSLRNAQQAYWAALIDHIVGEYQLLAAVGLLIDKPQFP
jgi:outer membrane protein TolC